MAVEARLDRRMGFAAPMKFRASRNLLGSGLVLGFGLVVSGAPLSYPEDDVATPMTLIAFGSCAKEREPQPVWESIQADQPDLFLFIGDNNYADIWYEDGNRIMAPVTSRERFEEAYRMMGDQPGFAALRAEVPVMATWDDHDYGANDAGREYPLKSIAQTMFLEAFHFDQADPLWQQTGIYHARSFGPEGRRVQIIMLDTRSFRDPLERVAASKGGPYGPTQDESRTVLGEDQWRWLEAQLRHPADVRIIVSSIQVVAYEHGWETWGNFPHERQRLYSLVESTGAQGVLFLSGDRHLAEISRDAGQTGSAVPYAMWDFTSSGMTDEIKTISEPNQYRVGPVYRGTNYGLVRLDWAAQPVSLILESRDEGGNLLHHQKVELTSLR